MNAAAPPLPWFVLAIGTVFILALAAVLLAWLWQRTAVLVSVIVLMFVVGAGLMWFRVRSEQTARQQTVDRLRALGNQLQSEHEQRVMAHEQRIMAHQQRVRNYEQRTQGAISGAVTINGEKVELGSVEFEPEATTEAASAGSIEEGRFATKSENAPGDDTEKKPASNLPDWVKQQRVRDGDVEWLVLSSSQHADLADATAEAQLRATQAITVEFQRVFPECANWTPPTRLIDSAFRRSHAEESTHDFGKFTSRMYRVYLQVELSTPLRAEMHAAWAQQMRLQRLWMMCAGFAAVTVLLAGFAGYFRIFARSPQMHLKTHYA